MPALRPPCPQGFTASVTRQIRGQGRAGPHRIDAGLFARRFDKADTISGREYVGIVRDLERGRYGEEAAGIAREAGRREPARRRSIGCEQNGVGLYGLAIAANDGAGLQRRHHVMFVHLDPRHCEVFSKCTLHPGIVSCQQGLVRHQDEGNVGIAAIMRGVGMHACAQGEDQFDAARTASDNRNASHLADAASRPQVFKLREERPDRFDGDAMFRRTGNGCEIGRYSDVDRQNVVGDRRPGGEQHPFGSAIEPDRLRVDEAGSGYCGEPDEIDVRFVRLIETRNDAREHAGIGRFEIAGDERHSHARQWSFRERLDDVHVGVAAAEQHNISRDMGVAVHDWPVRARAYDRLRRSP